MVSSIDTILAISSSSIVIGRIVGKSSASFSQSGRRERTIEFAGWRVTLSRCVVRFCFILVLKAGGISLDTGRRNVVSIPLRNDPRCRQLIIFSWQLLSGVGRACVFGTRCAAHNAAMLGRAQQSNN